MGVATRSSARAHKECSPFGDGWTYRLQKVSCGKRSCNVCRGRWARHGPYWYAEREVEGKTRTKYIGQRLVSVAEKAAARASREFKAQEPELESRWRWDGRHMSWSDAIRILGLQHGFSQGRLREAYRSLAQRWHPDRAKDAHATRVMVAINRAYEYLRE